MILGSCKKKSFPSELKGEWEWSYSIILLPQYDNYGNFTHFEQADDTIFSKNNFLGINFNASVIVKNHGGVILSKDQEVIAKIGFRKFIYNEQNGSFHYYTEDYLKEKSGSFSYLSFSGALMSPEYIIVRGFPFRAASDDKNINELSVLNEAVDSITLRNYFIKK